MLIVQKLELTNGEVISRSENESRTKWRYTHGSDDGTITYDDTSTIILSITVIWRGSTTIHYVTVIPAFGEAKYILTFGLKES